VSAIKGSLRIRGVLKKAIRDAPADAPNELRITYRGEVLKLDGRELANVRRAVHNGRRPPNQSRVDAAEALLEALWRKADSYEDFSVNKSDLITELGERIEFHRFVVVWWQLVTPAEVLYSLSDRRRLARAAGRVLSRSEVDMVADSWADPAAGPSVADVALLDELRMLLGKPPKRRRRRENPDGELRTWAERQSRSGYHRPDDYDEYSHVVVDEAQDLSPMQWRMVGRRGKYASWTVVGDPVQSSWPDPREAAQAREAAFGGPRTQHRHFALRTNYRNSAEIFDLAGKVVVNVATPDQLPNAVRSTGIEPTVSVCAFDELTDRAIDAAKELLGHVDGTVGVITATSRVEVTRSAIATLDDTRLRVVDGLESKGLEYDAVVLVEPDEMVTESTTGPRTLYVALTRATQRLTVLTTNARWPAQD
ncbi:MAG: ATP-binding domain-containing protein, partial [Actinomycetota bacterium]|nr:ATP-binding domain-containing protein [Actinomycetota bacterium]